jgi:Dolichyl-phosphate-mannose-protein mannosyltransferase
VTGAAAFARSRLTKRDIWALAGLLALAIVLPTVIGAISGSLDIPRNDDWTYRRIALKLFETGRLELNGFEAMILVGQLVVAQPFLWLSGGATWGLTMVGVLSAAITIVAGYLLVRRLVSPGRAALAMLLLPLFPGFLPYAASYMTDLPAMAAEFVCLGLGIAALGGGRIRGRWFVASLAFGVFGFSVREFAIAAPASVLAAAVLVQPRRLAPWLSGFAVLASCVAIYYVRSRLPSQLGVTVHPLSDYFSDRVARGVSSLAFVLLPAAVVAAATWWRHWRLPDAAVGLVLGSYLVHERVADLVATGVMPPVLLDNLASQWGTPYEYATLGGIRPVLFSDIAWSAINGLALVATILVFAVAAGILGFHVRKTMRAPRAVPARLASPAGIVLMFVVATVLGLIVFGLIGNIYDRYFWPVVPTLAALMLIPPLVEERVVDVHQTTVEDGDERRSGVARPIDAIPTITALTLIVLLGGIGLSFLLNSAAFDSARWRAGERLVHLGVRAESIDAGFEWVGYHATGLASFAHPVPAPTLWEGLFPSFRLCGFVAATPQSLPGARLVAVDLHAYRLLLFAGPDETLYLYRVDGPRCGAQ